LSHKDLIYSKEFENSLSGKLGMANFIRKNNCVDKAADNLVLISILSDSEFLIWKTLKQNSIKILSKSDSKINKI
jgi:hypothetical protein